MKQINHFVGTAGGECSTGSLEDGRPWASFRLAVNYGYFDNQTGSYREIDTSWYDVSCYGELARNVPNSIRKGDALIVAGRLRIREWSDEKKQTSGRTPQIVAEAIGHNLRFGTAKWSRNSKSGQRPNSAADSDLPPGASAAWAGPSPRPGEGSVQTYPHGAGNSDAGSGIGSGDEYEALVDPATGELPGEGALTAPDAIPQDAMTDAGEHAMT